MDLKVNINIVATRGDFINSNDKLKAGSSNKGNKNTLSSLIQPWYVLVSVRLWNFKDGGSKKVRFLAKTRHTCNENFLKIPMRNVSSSNIGHDFRK